MKIVIDTDIGNGVCGANTDDGLALALALASKKIDLKAITTLSGNVSNHLAYAVARNLISELGVKVPVFLGSSKALLEDEKPWRKRLDESVYNFKLEHLWQDFKPIKTYKNAKHNAVYKLCELARVYKNELIVCAIGPLTNIAQACVLDSNFAKNVKEIVIMGGVFDMSKYPKDTNFGFDPEAARIVLRSGAKITLAPYNITMQTSLQHSDLEEIRAINNKLCDFLYKSIKPWISYAELTRGSIGTWIHDALVIAYLLDSSICKSDEYYVDVETCGEARGKSTRYDKVLNMNIGIDTSKLSLVKVLRDIDNEKLLRLIKATLDEFSN
ncbi:nucleoside hydrolase [Campylobacter sp. RM5004]|uniref:nucleoside hydrolase n=1 Tax=Campylobacter sp. RM5004 TaxID=1660078 RepID=UPI001EFA3351|nr:nucleoside hydrolase [Campylobacter sp. RM5004]ULO02296.1 nucleoside hydrolase [Campylobacter sp. RM5004]